MIEIPNNYYRTSIKALVLDENKKFLLTKDEKTGRWDLPGGGLDFGEDAHACITREIMEEMGIPVVRVADNPSYFLSVFNNSLPEKWLTNIVYEVKLEHLNFTPSDECVEIGFFSVKEAAKQDLYNNVVEFIKLFNPANH